jgi:hypothetical protein
MNAQQRITRLMLAGAVGLALSALTVLLFALPTTAGPTAQDWTPIPTPTPYPVDEIVYKLETVGGDASPQVFPAQEVDGVTFGETTVKTEFPNSMDFSVTIESDTYEIDDLELIIRYNNGSEISNVQVSWDDEAQVWVAKWSLFRQFAPWTEVQFKWVITNIQDTPISTAWHPLTLVEPSHEWHRVMTEHATLYWYGFGEDNPEHIARDFARVAAATHQRLVDGFDRGMSYMPVVVIYPDDGAVITWTGDVDATRGIGVVTLIPDQVPEDYLVNCALPSGEWSLEYRTLFSIENGSAWQLVSLIMADILTLGRNYGNWDSVNNGPAFWSVGHNRWFIHTSTWDWPYDEHVKQIAAEYGLKSLRRFTMSDFFIDGPDGCPRYVEDIGASFINWLIYNYGMETHRQIVKLMTPTEDVPRGMDFYDAIEQATGKSFDELENEWRAYLELPPLE